MEPILKDWQKFEYFPDGYNYEPERLLCDHNLTYRCSTCGECYACKHKLLRYGDGSNWWKCRNGKKKLAKPD